MRPLREESAALLAELDRSAPKLSDRETEVAQLVACGLSNREIASALHLSERTAESHVKHIMDKLGFKSRSQIAAWAVEEGLASAGGMGGSSQERSRKACVGHAKEGHSEGHEFESPRVHQPAYSNSTTAFGHPAFALASSGLS